MQSYGGNFEQGFFYGVGRFYPCTRLNLANMLTGLPNGLQCESKVLVSLYQDEEIMHLGDGTQVALAQGRQRWPDFGLQAQGR